MDEGNVRMLLAERSAPVRSLQTGLSGRPQIPGAATKTRQRCGTAVYHCYRYQREEHGNPTDAEGTVLLHLPAAARAWHKNPWHQFEAAAFLDAEVAIAWLSDQLRAAGHLAAADPEAASGLEERWRTCKAALDTRESACHTSIAFPSGDVLALAIVAVWDPDQTHPLLRPMHPDPEGSAP